MNQKINYTLSNECSAINEYQFVQFLQEVNADFQPKLTNKIDFHEYYKKVTSYGNCLYVLKENKLIAMTIYYDNNDVAHITLVAVKKEYRKKGIAKDMLHYVTNSIKKSIQITTWSQNKPAISLYEDLGFNITKKTTNKYGINELILIKK